jgi:hypothetical protein
MTIGLQLKGGYLVMISKYDIIHVGEGNYSTLWRIFKAPVSPGFSWSDIESLMQVLGVSVSHRADIKLLTYPDPQSGQKPLTCIVYLRYSEQLVHAGHVRALKGFLTKLLFTPERVKP